MKRFAELFTRLDQTTRINPKVDALATYFTEAPESDRLWTIALLSHRRPRRTVTTTRLREWAAERAGIPLWLFEETYPIVGDLAETIALVLPDPDESSDLSLTDWINEVRALALLPEADRKARVLAAWDRLDRRERFLFNKLITGGFRMGLSQKLMTRALSRATGIAEAGSGTPIDGRLDARDDQLRQPDPRPRPIGGSVETLSVLPCLSAGGRDRGSGRGRGMGGGTQVGRNPGSAHPARRAIITSGRAARS